MADLLSKVPMPNQNNDILLFENGPDLNQYLSKRMRDIKSAGGNGQNEANKQYFFRACNRQNFFMSKNEKKYGAN